MSVKQPLIIEQIVPKDTSLYQRTPFPDQVLQLLTFAPIPAKSNGAGQWGPEEKGSHTLTLPQVLPPELYHHDHDHGFRG